MSLVSDFDFSLYLTVTYPLNFPLYLSTGCTDVLDTTTGADLITSCCQGFLCNLNDTFTNSSLVVHEGIYRVHCSYRIHFSLIESKIEILSFGSVK